MLVVKACINDADDNARAVITLRQAVFGAVDYLAGVSHAQGGVGAQVNKLADFHIDNTRHLSNLGQFVHGYLGRDEFVKVTVDDYTLCLQGIENTLVVNFYEGVHHFYAIDDA